MAKSSTFENDLLKLIFNATAISSIADNAASSPITSIWVALHTADPGTSSNQSTSETTYVGYLRTAVTRTSTAWTVSSNSVSPAVTISFPIGTGGSGTVQWFSVGTSSSGTGKILYSGSVSPSISVGNGVTPQLNTSSAITET